MNKIDENIEATNKLLLEIVKNQKDNIANMTKTFIISMICYTCLLIAMVIGFFVYENQFEVTDWEKQVMQEVETDGSNDNVNAIINTGEMHYGESETEKTGKKRGNPNRCPVCGKFMKA